MPGLFDDIADVKQSGSPTGFFSDLPSKPVGAFDDLPNVNRQAEQRQNMVFFRTRKAEEDAKFAEKRKQEIDNEALLAQAPEPFTGIPNELTGVFDDQGRMASPAQGLAASGKLLAAGAADAGLRVGGVKTRENLEAAVREPIGEPLPIEKQLGELRTAGGAATKGILGIVKSAPALAGATVTAPVVGPYAAFAGFFGAQTLGETGDTGKAAQSALTAALFPAIGKLLEPVGVSASQSLIRNGLMEEGNATAQKAVETAIHQAGFNAAAQVTMLPEYAQMTPEERKLAFIESTTANALFAIPEVLKIPRASLPSATQLAIERETKNRVKNFGPEYWGAIRQVAGTEPETLVRPLSSRTGLRDRLQPIENPNETKNQSGEAEAISTPEGSGGTVAELPTQSRIPERTKRSIAGEIPSDATPIAPIAAAKAEPTSGGTVGDVAAPAPKLVPVLTTPEGEIISAGLTHGEALKNAPKEKGIQAIDAYESDAEHRFVDLNTGKVLTRAEAGGIQSESIPIEERQKNLDEYLANRQKAESNPIWKMTPEEAVRSGADFQTYQSARDNALRTGQLTDSEYKKYSFESRPDVVPANWPDYKPGQKVWSDFLRLPGTVTELGIGKLKVQFAGGKEGWQGLETVADLQKYADRKLKRGDTIPDSVREALQSQPVETPANPQPAIAVEGAKPAEVQKYQLKGSGPQTHELIARLPASEVEIANGEQPVRVRNERTGKESTVLESDLVPVKPSTGEKRAKIDLDQELTDRKLDPSVFPTAKAKRAAIERHDAINESAGDKAKKLADKFREQFKTPLSQKELGTFGVATKIINAAVELGAKAIELSGKIVDGINTAIAFIRSNHEGDFDESGLRAHLEERFTQDESIPSDTTQVSGKDVGILSKTVAPDAVSQIAYTEKAFSDYGIPVKLVQKVDPRMADNPIKTQFRFEPDGFNYDAEATKLADDLETELGKGDHANNLKLSNLTTSIANSIADGEANTIGADGRPMLSAAVQERLFNLAQTPASQAGQVLSQRGLHSFDPNGELQMARNVDVNLRKVWRDSTGGGEHITPLMEKLLETFRNFFTPEEIKSVLDPLNLPAAVDRLIQLNQKDSGSRVYRQVQSRLKAKVPKTQEQKDRKAIEDEAVEAIIRHAAELGQVEPKKLPNQKLTPDQQLELVAKPNVAEKIQQATEQAVKDAEYNAGWKAEENAAKTPEEKADVEARKAAGEEPSPEMIQEGLKLKEYQHWKVLRDNLLNYSPTTVKLVQDVISGRFKGARFKTAEAKPEDLRIDFRKLAVAPEAEVQRVFDAQTAEVKDLLKGATPETVARVSQLFRDNIAEQLKQRRAEVVDRMFSERRPTGKESPDEIAAIKKQINAGLLRDQRLSDEELLQRAADKSVIRDLLPNTEDLVKRILEAPRYNLKDIKADVASELVKKLGLTDEQAKNLSELIYRSLDGTVENPGPLRRASENALKKVQAELAPEEKPIFSKGKTLWQKIERGVRAGLFDSGPVLEDLARSENWTIPTPAEKAQMKAWAEEEMRLRAPTQRQLDKHSGNVERATADAEAATEQERIALIKKIQANWSRWTMPIGLRNMFSKEIAQNNAKAVNEVVAANLLAKAGFFFRQGLDVGLVSMPLNAINRSLVHVLERAESTGKLDAKDLDAATREMMVARVASIRATIRQMERTATGHSNRKVVDRMTHSIGIFDRAIAKADSLESQGNIAGARALRLATLLRSGYRVAETWDAVQSVGLEWQEMRQQLSTDLRKAGKTHAEIALTLDDIFGKMKVDMLEATREAEAIGLERGLTKDRKTLESDAWRLVKAKAYDRMREAAGTKTDYAEENKQLQELHSWNLPETGGIGGVIAETIKTIKSKTEKAGVPTGGLFSFGNAMGIAANRMMTFSGMGLFGGFGFGDSPWYKGAREIRQRRIEAIEGLSVIGLVIALAAAGKIIVQTKYPSDKGEKEKFIAQGHKLNTVRWNNDDGSWIEYPIQMSPFSFIASPLYMVGGVQQLFADKRKAQAKLNAEALKNGTAPGQVPGVGAHDVLGVLAQGMYGMLTGGRTASGAIQSFSDYGNFNLNKAAAATVTPYLPGIPAWQEAARAMGVAMDTKTASVLELLVPVPGSAHQRVNALGDPLVNQNDAVRILQVMSGGIGFGNDQDLKDNHAYRQVFDSGYSIPEISRNKGYNFNDSIRHMTAQELDKYVTARGQALKEELAGVNVAGLPEAEAKKLVQGAFQRANNRALTAVGVTVPVSRATSAPAGRTRSTSRLRLGSRRSRGGLRSLRGSRSKLRSGFGKRRRRKFSLA